MGLTSNFKPGDRVQLVKPDSLDVRNGLRRGMTGVVRRVEPLTITDPRKLGITPFDLVLVQFDGYDKGHSGTDASGASRDQRYVTSAQIAYAKAGG